MLTSLIRVGNQTHRTWDFFFPPHQEQPLRHTLLIVPGTRKLPCFPAFMAITTFSVHVGFNINGSRKHSEDVERSLFHGVS